MVLTDIKMNNEISPVPKSFLNNHVPPNLIILLYVGQLFIFFPLPILSIDSLKL